MGETFVEWQEDWSQLAGGCNWYTFRFCQIECEWDKMLGGVEATVVIMGLGVRIRHNYSDTDAMIRIRQQVAEIESGEGN